MEAHELMIGSLVEHNGYVYKVMGIYGNAKFVDLFPCEHRNKENELLGPLTIMEKEISPIPLTEEILKANGLDPILCCNLSMPRWFMSLRNGNHHVEMPFEYVHQLQHALRLCGLTNLADNLKVND